MNKTHKRFLKFVDGKSKIALQSKMALKNEKNLFLLPNGQKISFFLLWAPFWIVTLSWIFAPKLRERGWKCLLHQKIVRKFPGWCSSRFFCEKNAKFGHFWKQNRLKIEKMLLKIGLVLVKSAVLVHAAILNRCHVRSTRRSLRERRRELTFDQSLSDDFTLEKLDMALIAIKSWKAAGFVVSIRNSSKTLGQKPRNGWSPSSTTY
jgi:hypothetical protein